jgi:hypothetical protein
MLIKGYGDFGQEEEASWLTELTNFVSKAVVPTVQAFRPSAAPKALPPAGMTYAPGGQLVPKQAGLLGGISTTMLLGLAAAGAVALVVMQRKGRRRR